MLQGKNEMTMSRNSNMDERTQGAGVSRRFQNCTWAYAALSVVIRVTHACAADLDQRGCVAYKSTHVCGGAGIGRRRPEGGGVGGCSTLLLRGESLWGLQLRGGRQDESSQDDLQLFLAHQRVFKITHTKKQAREASNSASRGT